MISNMKLFFMPSTWLLEQGYTDVGFALYSKEHLISLALCVLYGAALCFVYRKRPDSGRAKMRRFYGAGIVLAEILKDIIVCCHGGDIRLYLPLHVCSFGIMAICIDAFFPKQRVTGNMLAYIFMPGAICAELFSNWTEYPIISFMSIFSFWIHAYIAAYFWMRYLNREIDPDYKGIYITTAVLAAAGFLVEPINIYLNMERVEANYMFLHSPSEGSPLVFLWDLVGERFGMIGYWAGYAMLAVACFHVLYWLYKSRGRSFAWTKKE